MSRRGEQPVYNRHPRFESDWYPPYLSTLSSAWCYMTAWSFAVRLLSVLFAAMSCPMALASDYFSGPLTITRGGTYSGSWRSTVPEIPAVWVQTAEPVIIDGCSIESAGDGIQAYNTRANITVRNCRGRALNPNVIGKIKGFFVVASNPVAIVVEHNYIEGFSSAVSAVNFPYEIADSFHGQLFTVRYNEIRNIDARVSDGHGGYLGDTSTFVAGGIQPHFLRDAVIEISWNQISNEVFRMGGIGDTISTSNSRGMPSQPIAIHNNFLQGSYPADPSAHINTGACMIQIGDSPEKGDVGYVRVHDNQVINFNGCGISVSSGHHNEVDHNRIISASTTPSGVLLWSDWRNGLQMWDSWSDPQTTLKPTGNPFWHDNSMHDNAVNVVFRDGRLTDPYFGIVEPSVTQRNNRDPYGRPATTADEADEFAAWQRKLRQAKIIPGPVDAILDVVEFYNASLDHYFITYVADEIAKLDGGTFKGWQRTGMGFRAYAPGRDNTSPVCRIYIPPGKGDGHFFGRDDAECAGTMAKNPSFDLESSAFFYLVTPTLGLCPVGTGPIYRVFSNRADANHRYTSDRAVRASMVTRGWVAEGDGADTVVMCAP